MGIILPYVISKISKYKYICIFNQKKGAYTATDFRT